MENGSTPYLVGVGPHGNAECACKAKVGELEVVAFVNEEVLRLQVAVQDSMGVAVEETSGQLVSEFLDKRNISRDQRGDDVKDKRAPR